MRPVAYDSCEPGRTTVPSAVSRCSSTVRKTPDWARAVCSSRTSGRQTGMVGPESYTRCRVSQRSVVGRSTGTHQRGAAPSRAMRCAVASSSSSCPTGASTRRLSGRRVRWMARGAAASGERGRGGWCAGRDGARARHSRRRCRARAAAGGRGRRSDGVRRAGSPGVRPAVCPGARVPQPVAAVRRPGARRAGARRESPRAGPRCGPPATAVPPARRRPVAPRPTPAPAARRVRRVLGGAGPDAPRAAEAPSARRRSAASRPPADPATRLVLRGPGQEAPQNSSSSRVRLRYGISCSARSSRDAASSPAAPVR